MTLIEAAKQALEALTQEKWFRLGLGEPNDPKVEAAIAALSAAIEAAEKQEPDDSFDIDDVAYALEAILQRAGEGATVGQVIALLENLAKPEQEPVAWMREDGTLRFADGKVFAVGQPFYTTPPAAQPAPVQEQQDQPQFYAELEYSPDWDVYACVYRLRADACPELVHREQLPRQTTPAQPAPVQEPDLFVPDFGFLFHLANIKTAARRKPLTQDQLAWQNLRNRIQADINRTEGRWGMHGHGAVDEDYFTALEWVVERMDEILASAQPAAPDFKAFKAWANHAGYDTAYTHDGIKWICLSPMTADLWKAWQAANGIKEKNT